MIALPLDSKYLYAGNGRARVNQLIEEFSKYDYRPDFDSMFSIKAEHPTKHSLQTLFINLTVEDPTEATFAEVVFGDIDYWLKARESVTLKPHLEDWRKVADTKRKAIAYKAIIDEVKTGGKSAFSAAKFLITEPEKPKTKATKKTIEETSKAAKSIYTEDLESLKDYMNDQTSYTN